MSEVIINKYLSLDGLRKYDELIKSFITSGDKVLADAITDLTNKIGSLEFDGSDDKTVTEIIEDIYASIADIVEKQDLLDSKDVELEGKINGIIGNLESLEGSDAVMTLVEISNKLKALDASVLKNAQDIVGVTERVSAVEEAIKNLGEIEGGESLGQIVSEVKLNTAAIATLKGDGEGSVKKAAADAQAAAIADAAGKYQEKGDYETAGAAAQALIDAQAYADGLVKDAEGNVKFDEAGAAADAQAAAEATAAADATTKANAALADAKEYTDSLVKDEEGNVLFDAAGTAAGLNASMDARVVKLEAIDHEKLAADASAAAVAAIVAGAESDFDTLKEVEEWIGSHKEGAAELQTTVSGHTESINTLTTDLSTLDTKVDQDIANLTNHMSAASTALGEVDGRLDALEVFVESHGVITDAEIEGLFA